jgi:hypothetical protein
MVLRISAVHRWWGDMACGATSMSIPDGSSLLTPAEREISIVHCRNSGQTGRSYDVQPTRGQLVIPSR